MNDDEKFMILVLLIPGLLVALPAYILRAIILIGGGY